MFQSRDGTILVDSFLNLVEEAEAVFYGTAALSSRYMTGATPVLGTRRFGLGM